MRLLAIALGVSLCGCPPVDPPVDDDDGTDPGYPACESPVAAPGGWTDGLPGSGVGFTHYAPEELLFDDEDFTLPLAFTVSAGVVSADLDQDGAVDLYFPQTEGDNALYWGNGDGTFQLANPGDAAVTGELASSASAADFDGDGDLDLAVMMLHGIRLLRLDGRTFTDVTDALGISQADGTAGTPSWADFDGDGDLDLYEGRHALAVYSDLDIDAAPDRLWRNDGDTFTNVVSDFPLVAGDGAWLHGVWDDFDGDGDLDLFHVNDFGDADVNSFLWENGGPAGGGWSWTDRLPASGAGVMQAPMGALVRDLNGDGLLDLWISGLGETVIYRALSAWEFVDATIAWAPAMSHVISDVSWSVVDVDLDGDGVPGVLIVYGPLPSEPDDPGFDPLQPDRFFVGDPTNGYVDRGAAVFPAPQDGDSRGVGLSDMNADGVPDLVIGHVNGAPSLLLGRCTANRRLVVHLRDPTSRNRFAIGARVTVQAGGATQVQTLRAGGRGTYSGSDPVLFFGMGAADVATVTVRWPDGVEQVLADACAHCRLTVTRE